MANFGFDALALIAVIGLAGPLVDRLPGLRVPVVVGEKLVAGIVFGQNRGRHH